MINNCKQNTTLISICHGRDSIREHAFHVLGRVARRKQLATDLPRKTYPSSTTMVH